jgi:uncharacterized protein YkwD
MCVVKTLAVFLLVGVALPACAFANCGSAANHEPSDNDASIKAARKATLCLLNVQRRHHGLHRLRLNAKLNRAGTQHARDMVARQYFSHDTPSGEDFVQRILATNYVPASSSYTLAENLAWGSGGDGSPSATVRAWMASPGHRENILNGAFREIGIGIVLGAPTPDGSGGATYASEFGSVRSR